MLGLKLNHVSKRGHRWQRNQQSSALMALCADWDPPHYNDVIIATIASQFTSLTIVYSTFYSDADQRKHQSSALLAFVLGIHRGPVNSPHKWPVTRKMFPFDDVIILMWKVCPYHDIVMAPISQRHRCIGWHGIFGSCYMAHTAFLPGISNAVFRTIPPSYLFIKIHSEIS